MAFIITGDTHGTLDIEKVIKFFTEHEDEYSEDDYLIILGDVGVCGFSPTVEKETRKILRELPVTVLFIDGNHEHHQRLNEYPVDQWMGGKVDYILTHSAPREVAAALGYGEESTDEIALRMVFCALIIVFSSI